MDHTELISDLRLSSSNFQDECLQLFEDKLEEHISIIRQQSIICFEKSIQLLTLKFKSEIEDVRRKSMEQHENDLNEIQSLRHDKLILISQLDITKDRLSRALNCCVSIRSSCENHRILEKSFDSIRTFCNNAKQLKMKMNMVMSIHRVKVLKKLFSSWRSCAQRDIIQQKLLDTRNVADRNVSITLQQAALEQERLRNHCLQLESALQKETQSRSQMQDNIRRVLVRGMSAMNVEALDVLGSAVSQADRRPPSQAMISNMVPPASIYDPSQAILSDFSLHPDIHNGHSIYDHHFYNNNQGGDFLGEVPPLPPQPYDPIPVNNNNSFGGSTQTTTIGVTVNRLNSLAPLNSTNNQVNNNFSAINSNSVYDNSNFYHNQSVPSKHGGPISTSVEISTTTPSSNTKNIPAISSDDVLRQMASRVNPQGGFTRLTTLGSHSQTSTNTRQNSLQNQPQKDNRWARASQQVGGLDL